PQIDGGEYPPHAAAADLLLDRVALAEQRVRRREVYVLRGTGIGDGERSGAAGLIATVEGLAHVPPPPAQSTLRRVHRAAMGPQSQVTAARQMDRIGGARPERRRVGTILPRRGAPSTPGQRLRVADRPFHLGRLL